MQTPEFQGTHLFDRLCWAKENLDGVQSDYRVVYEDSVDECAKILVPDPNWMACALQGGILPPVQVYWELAKDEAKPDFKKHTRGYLLHETQPIEALDEKSAIEYLIMKDLPQSIWKYNQRRHSAERRVLWRNSLEQLEQECRPNQGHILLMGLLLELSRPCQ